MRLSHKVVSNPCGKDVRSFKDKDLEAEGSTKPLSRARFPIGMGKPPYVCWLLIEVSNLSLLLQSYGPALLEPV
jgi:hypothetical protein